MKSRIRFKVKVSFKGKVRFMVRVGDKDRVSVGMVFRVRVQFPLSIEWGEGGGGAGGNLSEKKESK